MSRSIGWNHVKVDIYTHSLGGLTDNDVILARNLDAEIPAVKYAKKFLQENPQFLGPV